MVYVALENIAPIPRSCNMRQNSKEVFYNSILTDLIARDVETNGKQVRMKLKELQNKLITIYKSTSPSVTQSGLTRFSKCVPAIKVAMDHMNEVKNFLERLSDRDITPLEIEEISKSPLIMNPLELFQERALDRRVRTVTILLRQVREYIQTLDNLKQIALHDNRVSESEIFQKQYQFLPSYSRRQVMFGYPLIAGTET